MFSLDALTQGIKSELLDFDGSDRSSLGPSLILNDRERGEKVLSYVLENLEQCKYFRFAVAFITTSGVACIHQTLKDALSRGCTGEILVSRYLNFSDPLAIAKLRKFDGVSIRFINELDFHGKLFYFSFKDFNRLLIGSSNLTQAALGMNTEVNLNISVSHTAGLNHQITKHIEKWINNTNPISDDELATYASTWKRLQVKKTAIETFVNETDFSEFFVPIQPNSMQVDALHQLNKVRLSGAKRSLVISATGTGKTVLSALDVKQFGALKFDIT